MGNYNFKLIRNVKSISQLHDKIIFLRKQSSIPKFIYVYQQQNGIYIDKAVTDALEVFFFTNDPPPPTTKNPTATTRKDNNNKPSHQYHPCLSNSRREFWVSEADDI